MELADGVQAEYADGVRATITLQGAAECPRCRSVRCEHLLGLLPAFRRRRWLLAEENAERWGPRLFREVGFNPAIWFPAAVDWSRYAPGEPFVLRRLRVYVLGGNVCGWQALFRDGAALFICAEHPFGRTRCTACGARDCRHYAAVAAELRAVQEVSQAAG